MNFSSAKSMLLKSQKEKRLFTFLIALLVAAALFVPYMIMSEGYFIFYGDFNVQQIPFYQECHRAIRSGEIFWNWNTDLGVNLIGSYSFYLLGSPFFWVTLLFPNSFVPYLMGPLLILKFALAALTGYMYIRRFTKTPEAASLGGILYAFSGFSVYNIFFNHFHEAIIFFPLLLLSMELLLTENKRGYFALAVFICALSNYFFFFGMVVFCVIYYIVRVWVNAIKFRFKSFLTLGFEAVLGLAMSAILLLPAILAITGNYRISEFLNGWDAIMYSREQIYANILQCFFFPPDIPARPVFFPSAEVEWSSLGGWLPVFSMAGLFTWFKLKKKSWLSRLLGICIFMSLVPILNSAFYAFNYNYYARWFYMPILLICLMTVVLAEDKEIDWNFGYKWVFGITLAVSLVIGLFPEKYDDGTYSFGLYTKSEDNVYAGRFLIAVIIAIMSLVMLGILLKIRKRDMALFFKTAIPCVCIVAVIYGNVFISSGRSHSYEIKDVVIDSLIEGEVDLGDQSQFRVDTYDCSDNTSMILGLPGINAFHSVVPASIFEFYDFVGVERSVGSRPETDNPALRPLLSVKYLLNRIDGDDFIDSESRETLMPDYKYVKTESGYYIYENENYIPYGFSYDYYMGYDLCEEYATQSRPNLMLKAILLTDEQIEKYGYMFKGELQRADVDLSDDGVAINSSERAITSAYSFKTDAKGFTTSVTREKDSLVFFSVPYDEGWSAMVNGNEVTVEKVNSGLMAVKVGSGDSVIRFEYSTPGLKAGIIISLISAIVLIIYIIIVLMFFRDRKARINYPEGDRLLEEWKSQIVSEEKEQIEEEIPKTSILDFEPSVSDTEKRNGFEGGFIIKTDIDEKD